MDSDRLLSEEKSFFYYEGSLTKPPCEEGVTHYVMRYPGYVGIFELEELVRKGIESAFIVPDNTRFK